MILPVLASLALAEEPDCATLARARIRVQDSEVVEDVGAIASLGGWAIFALGPENDGQSSSALTFAGSGLGGLAYAGPATTAARDAASARAVLRILEDARAGDGLSLRDVVAELRADGVRVSLTEAARAVRDGAARRAFCPDRLVSRREDVVAWVRAAALGLPPAVPPPAGPASGAPAAASGPGAAGSTK